MNVLLQLRKTLLMRREIEKILWNGNFENGVVPLAVLDELFEDYANDLRVITIVCYRGKEEEELDWPLDLNDLMFRLTDPISKLRVFFDDQEVAGNVTLCGEEAIAFRVRHGEEPDLSGPASEIRLTLKAADEAAVPALRQVVARILQCE